MKNFASIYASENDSTSLEQAIFLKLETTRGTLAVPTPTDFMYTIAGTSVEYTQPIESSPHRSGRHNNDTIKSKKELSWSLPALFNINESLGAPSSAEIDAAVRMLWKSTLGFEDVSAGAVYNSSTDPSLTFSLYEVGDKWSKQCRGCFVDSTAVELPGDGRAQQNFSGMGAEAFLIGIGKSTVSNDGGNTVTLQLGEGDSFIAGGLVMIIEANGTTRSADTPSGSARTVVSVVGDVITLSGAPLADADGSVTPIYLCYYEPATKSAISNPVTGLVGDITIVGVDQACIRSASIQIENGHEPMNFCFGTDALHGSYFTPASRLNVTLSIEMNVNAETIKFFNRVQQFEAQDITLTLGDSAGRHVEFVLPRVIFSVPSISVPESGSIPVTFEGLAYQTVLDAADELTVSFV